MKDTVETVQRENDKSRSFFVSLAIHTGIGFSLSIVILITGTYLVQTGLINLDSIVNLTNIKTNTATIVLLVLVRIGVLIGASWIINRVKNPENNHEKSRSIRKWMIRFFIVFEVLYWGSVYVR